MTRYSITGTIIDTVIAAGVTGIKQLKHTKIMFANLTEEQKNRLKSQGATVERVQNVKTEEMGSKITVPQPEAGTPTYSPEVLAWAAGFDDVRNITEPPLSGLGINVAIIDTGMRETHERLNGRVVYSKNYTQDIMKDGFNHGTGIASILLAMVPQCNILNLKVINTAGEGTTEEVIEAIEDCIDLWDTNPEIAPVIINMSIGAVDEGNPNDPLRVACRVALENRIWTSAAAGNGGPFGGTIVTPSVERYVFCTGSISPETLQVSEFSSRGPTLEGLVKPDAVFYGENIEMASALSDTATIGKSGTSFATPFTTGVAVLYLEGTAAFRGGSPITRETPEFVGEAPPGYYPDLEIQVSMEELIDTYLEGLCVKPEGSPRGKDYSFGYGIPFGTLMAQALTAPSLAGTGSLISMVLVIGMMGMMMKNVGKEM